MRYVESNMDVHRRDEFLIRTRVPTFVQFCVIFVTGYLVICAAYFISSGNFIYFSLLLLLLLAVMNGMMVFSVQRSRDQMLVTEFQNLLYSAAMSQGSQFCLIVRKDGSVVHADTGFRTMYPRFERTAGATLDDVFRMAGVAKLEADKVYEVFASNVSATRVIDMLDASGLSQRMVITIDPIRRPQDYLVLRGRPYVDARNTKV